MTNPTLVLVHGSWHSPEHFDLLLPILTRHGYESVAVSLPSTQSAEAPRKSLADDTAAMRNAAVVELDQGNDVVIVAHFYGGCPSKNALEGLDRKSRTAGGQSTAVTGIIFLCAVPLPAGGTFLRALGGKPHPVHDLSKSKDFAEVGPPGLEYYFYNDLSSESAQKYSKMLRPQAWIAYEQETSHAAFEHLLSWYLYCEKDQVLPLQVQRGIVEVLELSGLRIKTASLECSHSPFLSMPEETAEFIVGAAEESAKTR